MPLGATAAARAWQRGHAPGVANRGAHVALLAGRKQVPRDPLRIENPAGDDASHPLGFLTMPSSRPMKILVHPGLRYMDKWLLV